MHGRVNVKFSTNFNMAARTVTYNKHASHIPTL
jgi:hypothetical protein